MSDFEFDLKQAFLSGEEPQDAGFSVGVERRVARREAGRERVHFVALGGTLAMGAAIVTQWVAALAAKPIVERSAQAVSLYTADWIEQLGAGFLQGLASAGAISPLTLLVAAASISALVFVNQPE